jgi:hypothetical protein
MIKKAKALLFIFLATIGMEMLAYPYDGYNYTGIARLRRLELIHRGEMEGKTGPVGQHKKMADITLKLLGQPLLCDLPEIDPKLLSALQSVIPDRHKNYSITLMDITPGRPIRYAAQKPNGAYQPGSVGKLAVLTALFAELKGIYPDDFEARIELLKTKQVRAGGWAMSDEHTVPFFDVHTKKYFKRTVVEKDVFTLYEWVDHMISVSNNGAASVVWRELILMHAFGQDYPCLTESEAEDYFKKSDRRLMTKLAIALVNNPLRNIEISHDEWRLGSFFTRGATARISSSGGSTGTPSGLMKWMVALESGNLIDEKSSLEMKRICYATDRRIRYASTNDLDSAAVYFKSGSLYKCDRNKSAGCGKYKGNVYNYMNSIAIVEQPDGTTYMVALMTNVLSRNSNWDHRLLAKNIDSVVRKGFGDLKAKVNLEDDPEDDGN